MRLIDADELPRHKVLWEDGTKTIFIFDDIKDAPTIDAIPVEWIIETQKSASCGDSLDCGISELLELWQQEQEAR